MSTQGWQSIRSTNAGILVENAKYIKAFQNDLNTTPKAPITFQVGAQWNTITGLSQVGNTQFSLPKGYFLAMLMLEQFSPTSAKLQIRITSEQAAVVQPERGYSGLTVATDYAGSHYIVNFRIPTAGTIIEFFGEQSGAGGTLEIPYGVLNILRLYNTVVP